MSDVFVNVADLKDPKDPQGRTYREINNAKKHNIPIHSLVELTSDDDDFYGGVRLFVVAHHRDCDGTPLYALAWEKLEEEDTKEVSVFGLSLWRSKILHGIPEESLIVIKEQQ